MVKDTIKLILELLKLGREIYKAYRKEKDAKKKKDIKKAIEERDLAALRKLNLSR